MAARPTRGSLALQSAVRYALDPREIFNPGKN
jgi:hypothetical protein